MQTMLPGVSKRLWGCQRNRSFFSSTFVLLFLFERIGPAEQAYERPWGEPLKKPGSGSRHGT